MSAVCVLQGHKCNTLSAMPAGERETDRNRLFDSWRSEALTNSAYKWLDSNTLSSKVGAYAVLSAQTVFTIFLVLEAAGQGRDDELNQVTCGHVVNSTALAHADLLPTCQRKDISSLKVWAGSISATFSSKVFDANTWVNSTEYAASSGYSSAPTAFASAWFVVLWQVIYLTPDIVLGHMLLVHGVHVPFVLLLLCFLGAQATGNYLIFFMLQNAGKRFDAFVGFLGLAFIADIDEHLNTAVSKIDAVIRVRLLQNVDSHPIHATSTSRFMSIAPKSKIVLLAYFPFFLAFIFMYYGVFFPMALNFAWL